MAGVDEAEDPLGQGCISGDRPRFSPDETIMRVETCLVVWFQIDRLPSLPLGIGALSSLCTACGVVSSVTKFVYGVVPGTLRGCRNMGNLQGGRVVPGTTLQGGRVVPGTLRP